MWGVWRYSLQWEKGSSLGAVLLLPWLCLALFALWYAIARLRERAIDRWGTRGVLPARRAADERLQHV